MFSDDEDADVQEFEDWMASHKTIRNRSLDYGSWAATYAEDGKALRGRRNLQRVRYHLEGNYVPTNTHGTEIAPLGPRTHRFEQC